VGFEPTTFRLRGRTFPSDWTDLIGFSLLRLGALSIPLDPDGSRRIVWMIKRMIKGCRQKIGWQGKQTLNPPPHLLGLALTRC
jgi:hypothetical protein